MLPTIRSHHDGSPDDRRLPPCLLLLVQVTLGCCGIVGRLQAPFPINCSREVQSCGDVPMTTIGQGPLHQLMMRITALAR